MSSSPGEEAYETAEEDHPTYAQSSSGASSTFTTTLNEDSDSVYVTANQTPVASPDMEGDTASPIPIAAQYRASFEAFRRFEEKAEERRKTASLNVSSSRRPMSESEEGASGNPASRTIPSA